MIGERWRSLDADLVAAIGREAAGEVEACGILLGSRGGTHIDRRVAYPGPLFAHRFRLEPEWMLEIFLAQRELGREVAGFYHTHPAGAPLRPSLQDRLGHPHGALVMLVNEHRWRAYRAWEDGWRELGLRELPG